MKKLLLKNWRDIKSKKAQFGTLILLVALGVSSYVALTSGFRDLTASYDYAKRKLKLADFTVSVQGAPKSVLKELRDIKGVKSVEGRLIIDTGYQLPNGKEGTIRIIGIKDKRHQGVDDLLLNKGKYLKSGDKNKALVDQNFISSHNLKVGDTITAVIEGKKHKIKIKADVSSAEYLFPFRSKEDFAFSGEFGAIFMRQSQVEKLFKSPPMYNDFAFLIDKGMNRQKVIDRVEDKLEPYRVLTTVKQEDQPSNFRVKEEIRQNKESSEFMPGLILIISAISIYIALSRLVQSQRGEIGLSKALGYSNAKILFHYLVFAIFIAIVGTLLGFGLGQFFAYQIIKLYLSYFHIPFLKHLIYPEQFWASAIISSVSCMFGGLIPAYASARILPALAMRFDPSLAIVKAKTPLIERIFGFVKFPFTIKIPLRNVFRVKKRSFYTIIGIAFALILTVATWSSFDGIYSLIDTQFNKVERWDILVGFEKNFSNNLIKKVDGFKGVNKVQSSLTLPVKIKANGKEHETVMTAMKPNADFHGFVDIVKGDSSKTALEKDGLIMTPRIADKLKVSVGDTLKVKSPFLNKDRKYKLLSLSDELLGGPVYISYKEGKKLLNTKTNVYNVMYLNVNPKRTDQIREDLFEQSGVAEVMVKRSFLTSIEKLLESSVASFAILLFFAFAIAFVITYNTFTTNILERTREIATMRTIGEDRLHLAASITLENLFLAIVGIPLGVYLGVLASTAMFESLSTEAFHFKAIIYPVSYIYVVGSILIVLLLSEIPPIRRVFKIDLAEATKAIE